MWRAGRLGGPPVVAHPGQGTSDPRRCAMKAPGDAEGWQEAQDRVLLYLKKLGVPAVLSLEVALEALHQAAEEAAAAGSAPPLTLAMGALHRVIAGNRNLLEKTPYSQYPMLYRRWYPENPAGAGRATEPAAGLPSSVLPPVNRGSMTIKKI